MSTLDFGNLELLLHLEVSFVDVFDPVLKIDLTILARILVVFGRLAARSTTKLTLFAGGKEFYSFAVF